MHISNNILSQPTLKHLQPAFQQNSKDGDSFKDQSIHQLFETQAACTPEAIAISSNDTQLTYRKLNQRANQLAHYLRKLGVGPDTLVGLYLERSQEMIVGLLGILKAGGAYIPLDPTYPQARLAFMLEDSQVSILLTQGQLAENLAKSRAKLVKLDEDWAEIGSFSPENPSSQTEADHLAYVIYTSGSTGNPKGVMIPHKALINFTKVARVEYGLKPDDRVLQFASLSFDAAAEEIFPCLTCGATLVLRPELDSMPVFLHQCQEQAISIVSLPTAFWHQLATTLAAEKLAFPSSIRLVIIGGEKALPQPLHNWLQCVSRRVRLVNTYGPTETTIVATSCDLSSDSFNNVEQIKDIPIGTTLPGTQIYLLDQQLQPVARGTSGELYIGGVCLARGYLNRPDLTSAKFIPHPFSQQPGARLYKTGDLARYRPDGNLEFLGRTDHQIKVRGFRIEPGEIETVLRQHPVVQEAIVLGQDSVLNPGDRKLVAYIVPSATQSEITSHDLRQFVGQKLPVYMIPASFVWLATLPLTTNGKVDRNALPTVTGGRQTLSTPYSAPRTPVEERLITLWAELLGTDQIGIHDQFIELGGHSLLAVQLTARVKQIFQVDLSLNYLFEAATVAGLADYIETVRWFTQIAQRPEPILLNEGTTTGRRDEGEL